MTKTIKAQIYHKGIILLLSGENFQKAGELYAGWKKESSKSIQKTADIIERKRKELQKIIEETEFSEEKPEELEKLKSMLKTDYKRLFEEFKPENFSEELQKTVFEYRNQVKNILELLMK